jgi:hypothetical protein
VKKLPVRERPRPYADPYRGHEPWEGDSVLSSWSVDDKVNRYTSTKNRSKHIRKPF